MSDLFKQAKEGIICLRRAVAASLQEWLLPRKQVSGHLWNETGLCSNLERILKHFSL